MSREVLSTSAMNLYERLVAETALPIAPGLLDISDPVVRELVDAGFAEVSEGPPPRLLPVSPIIAFERVLNAMQDEFLDRQRQLLDAYTYLDGLQQRFLDAQPASNASTLADIRPEEGAFDDAVTALVGGAESQILCWNIALQQIADNPPTAEPRPLTRTVYDTAFLNHEGGAGVLRRARAAGQEQRIADELPSKMLIADAAAVVLPLGAGASGALVIRSPLVVAAMGEFFEMVWQRSVPWVDRERPDELLTPTQRQVVALMAVGRSDEEVSEHLGVSLRTVRRHVADIIERLGADTRFAAGIAAARAGLLDAADLPAISPPT